MTSSSASSAAAELQQSVVLSEPDDDSDRETPTHDGTNRTPSPSVFIPHNSTSISDIQEAYSNMHDTQGRVSEDRDASGDEDVDAEGEDINGDPLQPLPNSDDDGGEDQTDYEDAETGFVEREELLAHDEDDVGDVESDPDSDPEDSGDAAEAVGAVKVRDNSSEASIDDNDDSSQASAAGDDSDGEPWEGEDDVEEDEEDSDAAPTNVCMFCKEDEENDPSEEFETFLSCKRCKQHGTQSSSAAMEMIDTNFTLAHQQCAREAAALTEDNGSSKEPRQTLTRKLTL